MEILKHFAAIEGLDGSGTTTQRNLLHQKCVNEGVPCFSTSEPTGNSIGCLIRTILSGETTVTPDTLAYLFAADRNEHLYGGNDSIVSRLQRGEFVFTDRYLFSSFAYQSIDSDYALVFALNDTFPLPETLLYIEVSPETAVERSDGRTRDGKSRQEIFENIEFQRKVRTGYERAIEWAGSAGVKIYRYDGTLPAEEIGEKIWNDLRL